MAVKIEDCHYRMLDAHEVQAAMAFPGDSALPGKITKTEKVKLGQRRHPAGDDPDRAGPAPHPRGAAMTGLRLPVVDVRGLPTIDPDRRGAGAWRCSTSSATRTG